MVKVKQVRLTLREDLKSLLFYYYFFIINSRRRPNVCEGRSKTRLSTARTLLKGLDQSQEDLAQSGKNTLCQHKTHLEEPDNTKSTCLDKKHEPQREKKKQHLRTILTSWSLNS